MTETSDGLRAAIFVIEHAIEAAVAALPEDVFLFLSRTTPLINVHSLIQDEARGTLLTWRSDRFYGPGWHVPGGIIRFKETAAHRIGEVARGEFGATVEFDPTPVSIHESREPGWRDRGHILSLLYRCRLNSELAEERRFSPAAPAPDQWRWHERCPLIRGQQGYAPFMG